MLRFVAVVFCAGALAGCAVQPEVRMVNIRTDGQAIRGNPALIQQFEIDKAVCEGEMSKANLGGTQFCRGVIDCAVQGQQRGQGLQVVGKGCMAEKGYIQVPEPEMEARLAEIRANQPKPPIAATPVKKKN
jgi:hypothetical protein